MHPRKTYISIFATAIALLLVAISGCAQESNAAATVDGTIISMVQLDAAVSSYQQQFAAQGQPIPEAQLADFRSSVLDSLVRKTVLLNAADEAGISAAEEEITEELEKIRDQFATEEQYVEAIEAQGYTIDGLTKQITEDLTVSALIDDKVLGRIDIEDDEIVSFFEENSQYFVVPESVTASHILIELAEDASDEDTAAAQEKIDTILEELEAGTDFAEVARERSEGPSGPSGGSLGTFGRGQMVPPFEEAAFALEPGELSDVVRTQFGFHVILVQDKEEGRTQDLDEVREDILDYLRQVQGEDQINDYIEALVAEANVELNLPTE